MKTTRPFREWLLIFSPLGYVMALAGLLVLLGAALPHAHASVPDGGAAAAVIPGAASSLPDPGVDGSGWWKGVFNAVRTSNWRLLASLVLMGIVWALRRGPAASWLPWLATDRGGALLVLLVGICGAFANGLMSGTPVSMAWLLDGVGMGVTAAGGWIVVRRLVSPADKKAT